jgi:eukaryotic-like serine/threonine-protein kinase
VGVGFFNLQHGLPPGTQVDGRFELVDIIGQGGAASIYKAFQLDIECEVAVKIVTAEFGRENLRRNFERRLHTEAVASAKIKHPNVVGIRAFSPNMHLKLGDQEQHIDRPYLVMDYLEGLDLSAELWRNGPMAPERALPLFLPCLDAMSIAHDNEIIHKDLKPENLLVRWPHHAYREMMVVMDFGVARHGDAATIRGQVPFTPNYCAPEYIKDQIVTPALDVYQLGLILVEMLTGVPVVDDDHPVQCLRRHVKGELNLPQWLLDGPLGDIVVAAVERDHTARIPTAGALLRLLRRVKPERIHIPPEVLQAHKRHPT